MRISGAGAVLWVCLLVALVGCPAGGEDLPGVDTVVPDNFIDSVPLAYTGSASKPSPITSPSRFRLEIAREYTETAEKFYRISDGIKAIGSFCAARAWGLNCLQHTDEASDPVTHRECLSLTTTAALSLGYLVVTREHAPGCCSAEEALYLSHRVPELKENVLQYIRQSHVLLKSCPRLQGLALAKSIPEPICSRLILVSDSERIIGEYGKTQEELMSGRKDVPYRAAVKDLSLVPVLRFAEDQWRYPEVAQAALEATSSGSIAYVKEQFNMTLQGVDMFHSCIPTAGHHERMLRKSARTGVPAARLLCVWRRHPQLLSTTSAIFAGVVDLNKTSSREDAYFVSKGEDPRLFQLAPGRPFFSMQMVAAEEEGSPEYQKRSTGTSMETVFRNFMVDVSTGKILRLNPPRDGRVPVRTYTPDGKNWVPFTFRGKLHFIYTIKPLSILQCNPVQGDCTYLPVPQKESHGEDVGALRGGTAAHVFQDRYVVGFGHATLSSAQHSAFLYVLDMDTLEMRYSFEDPKSQVTPFFGYTYMDPTSFWVENNEFFVTCTLRSAPDYLIFGQSHHQTVIFRAESSILPTWGAAAP